MESTYHVPVLFDASLDGLALQPGGTYVDCTFGGGGHSRGILDQLGPDGRLFGFDCDPDAADNVPDDARFQLIPENFRFASNFLRLHGVQKVNGILGIGPVLSRRKGRTLLEERWLAKDMVACLAVTLVYTSQT